jgi:AraC-like DNA-binding protein
MTAAECQVVAVVDNDNRSAVVRSTDRDEARKLISELFSPHELEVVGDPRNLDVTVRAWRATDITLADIRHGTEVDVCPGRLQSYYEVNVPIVGHTRSVNGTEVVESGPGRAAVLNPTEDSTMRWSADCAQLAVKVSRSVIERTVEAVLGHPPDEAVRFGVAFDIGDGHGRNWVRSVLLLRDALRTGSPDLVVRPLEEVVVGQLLVSQSHNFSGRLKGDPRPARPKVVSRVIDLIQSDPSAALTAADMAAVAGTSIRCLQAAFSEHLGISPSGYLRRVRLGRAHQDLLAAQPGDGQTVADIAFRWGFGHVPRFASAYRDRYGTVPSQTLRS